MVGTRRLFVRCFLVSLMQVWSLWKASCACEGSVCHLFAKLFLGHGVFICVSMMCFFFYGGSFSNGFSEIDWLCHSDTTFGV